MTEIISKEGFIFVPSLSHKIETDFGLQYQSRVTFYHKKLVYTFLQKFSSHFFDIYVVVFLTHTFSVEIFQFTNVCEIDSGLNTNGGGKQ